VADQDRPDDLAADEQGLTRAALRAAVLADPALQQLVVLPFAVGPAEPQGQAGARLGADQAGTERIAVARRRRGLEPVVAVVAGQDGDVAAGQGTLEVPLDQAVGFLLGGGRLQRLDELGLRALVGG
jgi:hypothetical protein